MTLKKLSATLIIFAFCIPIVSSQKQTGQTRKEYIENYKDFAVKEMLRSGVPASITLAQGMLESENGNSTLAKKAKNHFGIKCHGNWKGQVVYHDDDRQGECFRKYNSAYESYQDHSDFLMSGSRYSFLFELDMTDYKAWAKGLKKAGYATSPSYAEMLIKIIDENELHQYDLSGASKASTIKARKKADDLSKGITAGREILLKNRVKYIIVKPEDTFRSLQEELDLLPFEIYKYNDLARDEELKSGQLLYIQPKRNRAEAGSTWHIVKDGETMKEISQIYAVKPEALYSKNLMVPGSVLKPGDKISLRKQLKGTKPVIEKKKKIFEEEEEEDSEIRFEFDK